MFKSLSITDKSNIGSKYNQILCIKLKMKTGAGIQWLKRKLVQS